jgi:hypothetical protein
MLMTLAAYSLAIVIGTLWNRFADLPIKPAYVIVFGLIFIGSAARLFLDRTGQSSLV